MMTGPLRPVVITGMGVLCSIGASLPEFDASIRAGRCGITRIELPNAGYRFGATLWDFDFESWLDWLRSAAPPLFSKTRKVLTNTTASTRWSVCAAVQAVVNSGLEDLDGDHPLCGLIVAGSNTAPNYIAANWRTFSDTGHFNPRYAISFWDSNQIGCLSEILSIHGPGVTMGAGAASGNAAVFQAIHWLRSGIVQRCLVVGAGVEFSDLELAGLMTLGAAFSDTTCTAPEKSCRPFDQSHAGFVYGEGSAAVLVELARPESDSSSSSEIAGACLTLDGNHLPEPSLAGEVRSMRGAFADANISPDQVGYLNAHGTGTPLGDRTECLAIHSVFQDHARKVLVNSTKSLTGHCFSASGLMELIACVLQLNGRFAHPNRNLTSPIDQGLRFVGAEAEPLTTEYALSNGFGFGGINSSVVVRKNRSNENWN